MKTKFLIPIIIFICCLLTAGTNIVKADTFSDNTLIYTQYNKYASFYDNLEGITCFDVSDKYITYTLDGSGFYLINRTTKNKINSAIFSLTFNNISELHLTKNHLFIGDDSGLKALNLNTLSLTNIFINASKTTSLPIYKDYSISEDLDTLVIAGINDKEFAAYFYNPITLEFIRTYTNSAIASKFTQNNTLEMLNIATTTTEAYIVNNASNSYSSSLWSVNYNNSTIENPAKLFPKPNIISLAIYKQNDTDYLLAVDNKNIVYVLRTDLEYSTNNSDFDADQTLSGNSSDTGFLIKDISAPEQISVHNKDIYISDSGTKCIQKFKFEIVENKGTIIGTDIVIASECGEVGRFNSNANIDFADDQIIVADNNNKRVQVLIDDEVINLNSNSFSNIEIANLNNLEFATKIANSIYFTAYNEITSVQYIYSYNLTSGSINTLTHDSRIFDMCAIGKDLVFVSSGGLYKFNTTTNTFRQLSLYNFYDGKIAANSNHIVVFTANTLKLYNLNDGANITSLDIIDNVKDITLDNNNIYVLDSSNSKITKYIITDTNIANNNNFLVNGDISNFSSISVNPNSGVLYLFDNVNCKIDRLINPNFNFKEDSGLFQVNNKSVSVYSRPYFLNGIDTPSIIKHLNINERVDIYSKTSISYGNIEYYIIRLNNNSFGYINKNDLTYLSENVNYEVILPDATLKCYDNSDIIKIYESASTSSNVVAETANNTRVLIVDYSEDKKFALVRYYDSDQNLITGYVSTSQLSLDDLSKDQIIALILIGSSILLLVIILISVKIIRKSRIKKLSSN
ncbi:MAG: hypothetical protein IJA61_00170 [Clostridia bacterium]|nr:hypothetical protein [Clostridia bacterium]